MTARDQFEQVLADFSAESGIEVSLGEDNVAVINMEDASLMLNFLPQSGEVVAWSTVGFLTGDSCDAKRIELLLKWNDDPEVTEGFSFALSETDGRILVHDHRNVDFLNTADILATWLGILIDVLRDTRARLEIEAPEEDDEDSEEV